MYDNDLKTYQQHFVEFFDWTKPFIFEVFQPFSTSNTCNKKNNSIMTQKNKLGRKTGSCVLSESRSVKLDRAMRPMRKSEK